MQTRHARRSTRDLLREGLLLAVLVAAGAGCHKQPFFSIPVCEKVDTKCHCHIGGWTICTDVCVDLQSDPANCGTCGAACTDGTVCLNGKCAASCGNLDTCDDGRCLKAGDPYNCGACGTVCEGACESGVCKTKWDVPSGGSTCTAGLTLCAGDCVDTNTDTFNCGACVNYCSGECRGGKCCPDSSMFCGGVCTRIVDDPFNCGGCGIECRNRCSYKTCY